MSYTGSLYSTKTRRLIQQHLDLVTSSTPDTDATATLVEHFRLFITILLNRHTAIAHQSDILEPTLELVDSLLSEITGSTDAPLFGPLDIHLYTIATFTLLEITDIADDELAQAAWEGLANVHRALEQIAERAHADMQERFSGVGLGVPVLHWADALLKLIDSKPRSSTGTDAGQATAAPNGGTVPTHQAELQQLDPSMESAPEPTDKVNNANAGRVQMIDFALLTRQGYLNVLADRVGV